MALSDTFKNITYDTVDELDILRALRVAVARSELGTSFVGGEASQSTVGVHLGEVEGTVETAGECRDVDVEGELRVEELEHLVLRLGRHQVDARADVRAGDELECELVGGRRDACVAKVSSRFHSAYEANTVCVRVVCTVDCAVLSAGRAVRADGGVPCVAGVAVGVAGGGMDPAPVGVERDATSVRSAGAASRAGLPCEGRVGLSGLSTRLLGAGNGEKRESDESGFAEHCISRRAEAVDRY